MNEQRIAQLQQQLDTLVETRKRIIEEAERTIADTNKWFDKEALPIHRELNRIRQPEVKPKPPKPKRQKTTMDYDPDWTDADIEHYKKLMGAP